MKTKTTPAAWPLIAFLTATVAAAFLAGCTSVLPTSTNTSQSNWQSYADAKASYDQVNVGKSTNGDIKKLGFDPKTVPNIKILNYVDVVNLFGPAFKLDDLPEGIHKCVNARESCYAYKVSLQDIHSSREGNIPADLLGFSKFTHVTGWAFEATVVMVNDVVVYKLWNGTPDIQTSNTEHTPLGPMQNVGALIPKP
jgi:hypothetical protein